MDYFEYKDALAAYLLLSYFLYSLIIVVKRYIFNKESTQIVRIPIVRNNIKKSIVIILTYTITIPIITYYFGKELRLLYCQFIDKEDYYLRRQGFFLVDYDYHVIFGICFAFYLFLLIKMIVSYTSRYTIRKDNFIIISTLTFIFILDSIGMGNDIRTYSYKIITVLFFLVTYFVVRKKVIKDLH